MFPSCCKVFRIKEEIEDKSMQYPDYYLQAFHAYDEGNLNWLAAFEVESATYSMALRTFPNEGLKPEQAHARLRANVHAAIKVALKCPSLTAPQEKCPALHILQHHGQLL
jgi:hypothetical protein